MKHKLRFTATSSMLAMLISDIASAAQAATALQVPEPGTLLLAGLGISALIVSRRKK